MAPPSRNNKRNCAVFSNTVLIVLICLCFVAILEERIAIHNVFIFTSSASSADEKELNRPRLPEPLQTKASMIATRQPPPTETVNIMYGLSGNASGFLKEFSISLKSVLLNAPLSYHMVIHVMADKSVYNKLPLLLENKGISTWKTRHQITIQTYNIQPRIQPWLQTIETRMNLSKVDATKGHTVGTWFRLFAHEIITLPSNNTSVLYMDSDAVVMANLDSLFQQYHALSSDVSFQWGATKCAGFIFLNLAKLNHLWDLVSHTNWTQASEEGDNRINDQLIFVEINRTHPEEVAVLPLEWDVHYANGNLWETSLLQARPEGVGMLHLNGGGNSTKNAFEHHWEIYDEATEKLNVVKDWRIVKYYNDLEWTWAKFMAASLIDTSTKSQHAQGYELVVRHAGVS